MVFDGREDKLQEVASQIPMTAKQAVRVGKRCYWYVSKRMRIATVNHPVRIVLFWKDRHATEASKALVSNRVVWEVLRMLKVYRHRWTGTEAFHRDAKQQLGLGDCQVRSGKSLPPTGSEGQTRHMYLVSAAYSLLMHAMHTSSPHERTRRTLTTIGEACRAVKDELLERLVEWVVAKLNDDHWSMSQIKAVLTQTYSRWLIRQNAKLQNQVRRNFTPIAVCLRLSGSRWEGGADIPVCPRRLKARATL